MSLLGSYVERTKILATKVFNCLAVAIIDEAITLEEERMVGSKIEEYQLSVIMYFRRQNKEIHLSTCSYLCSVY